MESVNTKKVLSFVVYPIIFVALVGVMYSSFNAVPDYSCMNVAYPNLLENNSCDNSTIAGTNVSQVGSIMGVRTVTNSHNVLIGLLLTFFVIGGIYVYVKQTGLNKR